MTRRMTRRSSCFGDHPHGGANLNYRFLDDRANLDLTVIYNGKTYDIECWKSQSGILHLVNVAGSTA